MTSHVCEYYSIVMQFTIRECSRRCKMIHKTISSKIKITTFTVEVPINVCRNNVIREYATVILHITLISTHQKLHKQELNTPWNPEGCPYLRVWCSYCQSAQSLACLEAHTLPWLSALPSALPWLLSSPCRNKGVYWSGFTMIRRYSDKGYSDKEVQW